MALFRGPQEVPMVLAAATLALAGSLASGQAPQVPAAPKQTITLDALLAEMTDRRAIATLPSPWYTCKQFSSYDRASTKPGDPASWFANTDWGNYLRTEKHGDHDEYVLADMDGPGAVVRMWSSNPRGTLRIYLDKGTIPVVESPMADVLGGTWRIGEPFALLRNEGYCSYMPIPYAAHCTITTDAKDVCYHVGYRTYPEGTPVQSFLRSQLKSDQVRRSADLLKERRLDETPEQRVSPEQMRGGRVGPGETVELGQWNEPGQITSLSLVLQTFAHQQAGRSTVLVCTFDGEQTVWCPLHDFVGIGGYCNEFQDWMRFHYLGRLQSDWIMPFAKSARIQLINLGSEPVSYRGKRIVVAPLDILPERLMHFHANWHFQNPIHALGGEGTADWNLLTASGKGVYVGDSLTVMNPTHAWWGEGDEKIYVDNETFPSHFGTSTDAYYGFANGAPRPFAQPFYSELRFDTHAKDSWGYTTCSRLRALDAIPFAKSFKFDMEVWHRAKCDIPYAATTFWYAMPGASTSITPDPDGARAVVPQPPGSAPFAGEKQCRECEAMDVTAKSPGVEVQKQDMTFFTNAAWSAGWQLLAKTNQPGDFVEVMFQTYDQDMSPHRLVLHATKSSDSATVRFSVNGEPAGPDNGAAMDLHSSEAKARPSGAIDLGVFTPAKYGVYKLRAEIVGPAGAARSPKPCVGLDCVVLTPTKPN